MNDNKTPARFERELTIRFSHCDPAGIVFFPQYLIMFNNLVEDFVSEGLGIPYAGLITERRTGLPTVSLNCLFSAVSRLGDKVTLWLEVAQIGGSSLKLVLGCRHGSHENGEARVRVEQVLVITDLNTHRPMRIPDDLRAALTAFQQD